MGRESTVRSLPRCSGPWLRLFAQWRCAVTELSNAMDRWCVALEQGDADEVNRLVMRNHAERSASAMAGQLGQMVGGLDRRRAPENRAVIE